LTGPGITSTLAIEMRVDSFLRRWFLPGILSFSILLFPSCVSSARHQRAVDEAARLRQENLELRRRLTEETVLREEAQEAERASGVARTRSSTEAPAAASASPAPRPAVPAAGPAAATPGEAARQGRILEEDLQGTPEASLGSAEGDDGILRVARHYRDRGQAREALEAYTRLIKEYPFSPLLPGAFMERGQVRERQGDRQGALSDYQTVAQAFPNSPEASLARRKAASLRN